MKRIILRQHPEGWMADFEHDEDIRALFGTTVLPTPFTSLTAASAVLAALRKRNPGYAVVLAD